MAICPLQSCHDQFPLEEKLGKALWGRNVLVTFVFYCEMWLDSADKGLPLDLLGSNTQLGVMVLGFLGTISLQETLTGTRSRLPDRIWPTPSHMHKQGQGSFGLLNTPELQQRLALNSPGTRS